MTDIAFTKAHGGRLSHLISDARARWALHRKRRAAYALTLRELRSLSDRELWDIGIVRSDIRRIAIEAADLA